MVRITIDIIPFGIENEKTTIHEIVISNTGNMIKSGEHEYLYEIDDICGTVFHDRGEGLLNLVKKVINSITVKVKKIPQNFNGSDK